MEDGAVLQGAIRPHRFAACRTRDDGHPNAAGMLVHRKGHLKVWNMCQALRAEFAVSVHVAAAFAMLKSHVQRQSAGAEGAPLPCGLAEDTRRFFRHV